MFGYPKSLKILLLFCYSIFFGNIALAESNPIFIVKPGCSDEKIDYKKILNHSKFDKCEVTKSSINDYEPRIFESSNNLLRRNGQNPVFCGEKIVIKGRVLDSNCVPISDAKVYLWQVGCDGKYPYEPLRSRVDRKKINISKNASTFQGSGVATTDNNGKFTFITICPGIADKKNNYVNFRVSHRNLGNLQTKFIISEDNLESEGTYYSEIIIPGKNTHRRY